MAFVNLPPNLQDIFYSITDRVAKLETGPNQAMYTAEAAQGGAQSAQESALYAQSVATQAQIQAINATVTANQAASQATIAQSQATIASSQATAAQTSANGKNTIHYSTSGPGSTANTLGDIWYQYGTSGTYANKVIAQYSGAGGTSWTSVTVSGLVIANIDAGAITTGTLSAIEINAGSGGTAFHVSPSGYMSAQGVYVKGNITADSGTFNGSIYANSGAFGTLSGSTLVNGWSISSVGLTGVGTGEITGGKINGSTIDIGVGNFTVNSSGALYASSANITGAITATSGSFTGSITSTAGSIGGWNITTSQLYTGSLGSPNQYLSSSGGGLLTGAYTISSVATVTTLTVGSTATITSTLNANSSFYNSGHSTTASTANAYLNSSTGLLARSTASSERYKHDIVNLIDVPELDPKALLQLPVRAFRFNDGYIPETDDRANMLVPGFIAEEIDAIYPVAADYNAGQVETWNDRMIVPAMLALIQNQELRIQTLEGK